MKISICKCHLLLADKLTVQSVCCSQASATDESRHLNSNGETT